MGAHGRKNSSGESRTNIPKNAKGGKTTHREVHKEKPSRKPSPSPSPRKALLNRLLGGKNKVFGTIRVVKGAGPPARQLEVASAS